MRVLEVKAKNAGMIPCIRLNGTSDINWGNIKDSNGRTVFQRHSHIQFYDYTKDINKMVSYLISNKHNNYQLTFSKDETNEDDVAEVLYCGGNVAVVFRDMPETYMGKQVINGDLSDLRFLDAANVVVGLKAKGKAKKDDTGFVV